MIASATASGRLLLVAGLLTLALTACGRRGALEPPPDPAAAAAQKQREDQRRQRQSGVTPQTPAGSGAVIGQNQIGPLAQTTRLEGDNPPPDNDDGDEVPSIVPSTRSAPTANSPGGRKRGYVIPKEPFILDPLL